MKRTYELIVETNDKDDLKQFLSEQGYTEFVDSVCDGLDLSAEDVSNHVSQLLNDDANLPLVLYFQSPSERQKCMYSLEGFGGRITMSLRDYDSTIWLQAWEDTEKNFITEKFFVCVEGPKPDDLAGRELLLMESKGAFGSGQHATTKAILSLLESEISSASSLLDVGTGTGILAIAAEKLGIGSIVATDIEDAAVRSALHNRKLNECSFEILHGSLPAKKSKFDIIVSNILPPVINNLIPEFLELLKPNGKIILAGFNEGNQDDVHRDAQKYGLKKLSQVSERGWLAVCFQPTKIFKSQNNRV